MELRKDTNIEQKRKHARISNIRKTIRRNGDFKHLTMNISKGKKIGLSKGQEEDNNYSEC